MLSFARRNAFLSLVLLSVIIALELVAVSPVHADGPATRTETVGTDAHTWTNYTNAGGTQGPLISQYSSIQISCWVYGFRVANGNTYWYQIAQSPWNYNFYVSADAFYNNGATSGSLKGTPWVDPAVPQCGSGSGVRETTGGAANTWTNYTNAGGTQGQTIGTNSTLTIACKLNGFKVADGNTWWYRIASSPWNNGFYVSADAFYNNGQTSGSLRGTPFVDAAVPDCGDPGGGSGGGGGSNVTEFTGGSTSNWTNYASAGGTRGPTIGPQTAVAIACKVTGFRVADGNTWWYEIASSPWNGAYYASADAFYNDGATSGSLHGTPFVDPAVPTCSAPTQPRPAGQTAGPSGSGTFTNYNNAGGIVGQRIGAGQTVQVTCRINGFAVQNGNTWWYQVASSPWNDTFYSSADNFYNNGATSGSLAGTPFVDPSVPVCSGNREVSAAGHARGTSTASSNRNGCRAADPVNCASGDFYQQFTDISVKGRGPGLVLQRTYNDQAASIPGAFGNGWTSTFDQHLSISPRDGSATVTLADGSQVTAQPDGSGGFTLPSYANSTLVVASDGTYIFTLHATTVMRFSAVGALVSIADLNGNTTSFAYSNGQLSQVSDGSGRQVAVTEDALGHVSSVTDPMGRVTSYGYDTAGNLTSVTDPMSRTWSFTYDGSNLMTKLTDPRGDATTNVYDGSGRVVSQTDRAGLTTTFAYTGDNFSQAGGLTTVTDPHGNVSAQTYSNGYMTQVVKGYGSSVAATWLYAYDPSTYGITRTTDPNGDVTTRSFNGAGLPTAVTDALGRTTSTTYNALNEPLIVTDPSGDVTTNDYDGNGNLTSSTDPMGGTTANAYADSAHPGDLTSTTTPAGRVTTYAYDAAGDVRSATTAPSATVSDVVGSAYDQDGEQVCMASANATAAGAACSPSGAVSGTQTTAFDAAGEATSVTDAAGNTSASRFDADGNRVQTTSAAGEVTTTTFDADDRRTSQTVGSGAGASTTSYGYDLAPGSAGCPTDAGVTYCTSSTDPSGHRTLSAFDARDNRVEWVLPGGVADAFTYDAAGNKLTKTDASGNTTRFGYDAANQLTSVSYSDGTTHGVTYAYDSDGRRTDMTDGTGTTHTVYDADGRPTAVTNGAGSTVSYAYDADGNVTALGYPGGRSVSHAFDGENRLVCVTDWFGNETTFGYDHDGNVTSTAYPDSDIVGRTYNVDDQLSTLNVAGGGSQALFGLSMTRDSAQRVTSQKASGAITGTVSYGYDDHGRLASGGTNPFPYGYDADGNLTSVGTATQSYTNDEVTGASQPTGSSTFGYDQRGNRTSRLDPTGGSTSYTYDQADRLTQVTAAAPSPPSVSSVSPAIGATVGGDVVTIAGSNFTGTTSVLFGATPAAAMQVLSDTQIQATAPAHASGKVHVTVEAAAGKSKTGTPDYFTFKVTPPVITGIAPTSGPLAGGTSVVITGRYLSGATNVIFGSTGARSFNVDSPTQITAVTPAEKASKVHVLVTTPSGTSRAATSGTFQFSKSAPVSATSRQTTPPASALAEASVPGSATMGLTESYTYNGDGLRATKTTQAGTVQFAYDTTSSVPLVLDDGGNAYVYGPGDQPIEQVSNGAATYFVQDALGSTRALLDASGAVVGAFTYGPFGLLSKQTGTVTTPLQYAGTYADATGLDYAINRYYDPSTKVFLTLDPELDMTLSPYHYVTDDPINSTDKTGLAPWTVCVFSCIGWDGSRGGLAIGAGLPSVSVGHWSLSAPGLGASVIGYDNFDLDVNGGFFVGGAATYNVASGRWSNSQLCVSVVIGYCGAVPTATPYRSPQSPTLSPGDMAYYTRLLAQASVGSSSTSQRQTTPSPRAC